MPRACFHLRRAVFCLLALAMLAAGCDGQPSVSPVAAPSKPLAAAPDAQVQLTQVSIINALMLGQYDGVFPIGELLRRGNFGLGTCDHLDGELIVLDGIAYQARADATIREMTPDEKTPFAAVVQFPVVQFPVVPNPAVPPHGVPSDKDSRFVCPAAESLEQLEALLDKRLPGQNVFLAIRIEASLASVHLRSVPRQEPPYRPLAEAAKGQATWRRQDVAGTLIGFRCPPWVTGINVPGYHWHFLSNDHRIGGHVLDCKIHSGNVAFERCDAWLIKLNDAAKYNGVDLNKNLKQELESVERAREK